MFKQLSNILHESNDFGHMMNEHGMFGPFRLGGVWMLLFMMGYSLVIFFLAVWIYQDAKERGKNATMWCLVVLFTMGIGILAYSWTRQSKPSPMSKLTMSQSIQKTTSFNDGMFCENCGDHIELIDQFCAKCGTAV
jgi:apolipoprotein N-acyltransferase